MTVTTTVSRISYTGDGTSTVFAVPFYFLLSTDIAAYVDQDRITTGYSVSGAGVESGGSVTFDTAPAVGANIQFIRDPDSLQNTHLPPNDPFPSGAVETGLDKLTMLVQRIIDRLARIIQFPDTESTQNGTLPIASARANHLFGFDALGNIVMAPITTSVGAGDLIPYSLVSGVDFAPGATSLPLPRDPGSPGNIKVNFDGVPQDFTQWSLSGMSLEVPGGVPSYVTRVWGYIGTTLSTEIPPDGSVGDDELAWGPILYRAVDSVAELRQLSGTIYRRAETAGYNGPGTFGRGKYWNDTSDTTSVDDGGMVIVGNDGTRWKLVHDGQVTTSQYGAGAVDDTTRLQAALIATAAAGVQLWFDALSTVSAALNLTSGTDIDGFPWCGIKLKDNCTPKPVDLLRCNTATGVRIKNITVNANRTNNIDHGTPDGAGNQATTWQGTLLAAIDFAYVTDFKLEDLTVRDCWGSGIWITDCQDGEIEGNYVLNHRITGIAIRNNTADPRPIKNIRVTENHVEGGIVGIHTIFGVVGATISNNVCINNKDQNRFPAYAYSGTYPNVYPSTGGFKAFGQAGYVTPALPGDGAGIEATGVFTDPSGTANLHVAVTGNTCSQNAVGIRMEETTNKFAVTGNTCLQNDFYGVLALSAYFNTISGNTCSLNGLDAIRLEKIPGKPQAANNVVTGNICTENGRFGVIVVGSQGNIIQGNNLSGNGSNAAYTESGPIGLYVGDSIPVVGTLIQGNQIQNTYGTDKYGIYSNSTSNVGNTVLGNQFSGSYVTAKNTLDTGTNTFVYNPNFP